METEEDNDESDDESFKASGSEDSASGESDIDDEELWFINILNAYLILKILKIIIIII